MTLKRLEFVIIEKQLQNLNTLYFTRKEKRKRKLEVMALI